MEERDLEPVSDRGDSVGISRRTFNEWSKRIYDFNVSMGWHEGAPNLSHYLMNLHSEVSEWWEAWRKGEDGKPCDKAEKMTMLGYKPLTCAEEEAADILIRILDTAHAFGIDIDRAVETKMAYNATRGHRYGGKRA